MSESKDKMVYSLRRPKERQRKKKAIAITEVEAVEEISTGKHSRAHATEEKEPQPEVDVHSSPDIPKEHETVHEQAMPEPAMAADAIIPLITNCFASFNVKLDQFERTTGQKLEGIENKYKELESKIEKKKQTT